MLFALLYFLFILRRLQKSEPWGKMFFNPNLTKNERKLCTLIHMNLSTKEIANITHQSIGSINVARSRLRQKFGLTDSEISFIVFLDKFKN